MRDRIWPVGGGVCTWDSIPEGDFYMISLLHDKEYDNDDGNNSSMRLMRIVRVERKNGRKF